MGIYYYKGDDRKLLRKAKREEVCTDIVGKFQLWYADLESSRSDTVQILKELFPHYNQKKKEVKKIPDVYEQYKTYTSAMQKSTYQNYDGMVDIEGEDLRSNNLAGAYKASLVYDFYKMNLKGTLDAVLDDWTIKGEGAVFVHWDKKVIRKPTVTQAIEVNEKTGEADVVIKKGFEDVVEHEGVHIKRIDPHNLYYDKSQRHNWGMCGKIYRDFIPVQYVLTNQEYSLTNEERKEIQDMVNKQEQDTDQEHSKNMRDKKVLGNCIEVLEYRGDYIMPSTNEIIHDVEIVIIAGKYLARLEESKYVKCPIVYGTYLERPDTLRGQSPLKPAYILADVENKCMDLSLKAWELNTTPTFLTPKGALSAYTKLEAGRPIEYDTTVLGGQPPQKLDFSSGMSNFEYQKFFKGKMEGATGISQYLQGSQEGSVRTASESTYINQGATMRISREAYLFTSRIILPMIETFALFKKYEDNKDREVKVQNGGSQVYVKVDEEVRQGNYTFIIGGSQSAVEREAETQKLFQLLGSPAFQSLSQLMDAQTASELLKWVLNRNDFRGTDQIFEMMNINSKLEQLADSHGIQPQNREGFKGDMRSLMTQAMPDMAQALQEQPEQLQQ
jgi:hypothetical protein